MLESQKEIITASIPFLEQNGVDLTARFYGYMLESFPEVRPFFNKSHQATKKQPKILAFALLQYAKNINDLTPLTAFVRQIVEKHVGLQVTPEQYQIVGSCLLKTLKEMLGDAASDEFMKAWEVAYTELADILIQLEKERYAKELETDNAWLGFKDAKVEKVVEESKDVKSVYIVINDGKLPVFTPGQYITIRLSINGDVQSREYSLSNTYTEIAPSYYRISVRRIPGGVVSNYIHDHLKAGDGITVTSPYGKLLENYQQSSSKSQDAVFYIAGIGITPAVSLVEYFLQLKGNVKLYLSNHDQESRVFGNWLQGLISSYDNIEIEEFISNAEKSVESTKHKVHNRRINGDDFRSTNKDIHYFIIGPNSYMKDAMANLSDIPVTHLNSEEFGPVSTA